MSEGITIDSLSDAQREIADVIGLENYIKLTKRFGGSDIYVQKHTELLRPSRDKEIRAKFTGRNYEELSAEYNLTVRTIYGIVSPMIRERRNRTLPDQLSFERKD